MEDQLKKSHLEKTFKAFSYNILGVILPFILSLLAILVLKKYAAIWSFLDQGQFLLFGAGLYTTSIFLFGENRVSISKKRDKIMSNLSFWLLIVCSALYAIIYCLDLVKSDAFSVNTTFIRFSSLLLFSISIFSVYRSLYIDFLSSYPDIDVKGKSKEGVEDIMKNLK